MGAKIVVVLTLAAVGLIASCSVEEKLSSDDGEPRFRLTVEEAGFVATGELFRVFGEAADPVMVEVAATRVDIDRQPAWRLDTVVHVLVDGQVEERRWRFWVGLDESGAPAVLRGEEIPPDSTDP